MTISRTNNFNYFMFASNCSYFFFRKSYFMLPWQHANHHHEPMDMQIITTSLWICKSSWTYEYANWFCDVIWRLPMTFCVCISYFCNTALHQNTDHETNYPRLQNVLSAISLHLCTIICLYGEKQKDLKTCLVAGKCLHILIVLRLFSFKAGKQPGYQWNRISTSDFC